MTPEQSSYLDGWTYAARTVAKSRWWEVTDLLSRAMAWTEDHQSASMSAYSAGRVDAFSVAVDVAP